MIDTVSFNKLNTFANKQEKKTNSSESLSINCKSTVNSLNNTNSSIISYKNIAFKGKIETIKDMNIDEYHKLSGSDKISLRKEYSGNKYALGSTMPLATDAEADNFLKVSEKVVKNYKNDHIVGLGRSPLWFLEAAKLKKDGIENYTPAAFSGGWFYQVPDTEKLQRIEAQAPNKEQTKAYRDYLTKLNLDPEMIVKQNKQTGKKVVIVDFLDTGKGVHSFIDFLQSWADEKKLDKNSFKKALSVHSIESMENPSPYSPPSQVGRDVTLVKGSIYRDFFSGTTGAKNALGIKYPPEKWGKIDPLASQKIEPKIKHFKNLVKFRLLDYLASKKMLRK